MNLIIAIILFSLGCKTQEVSDEQAINRVLSDIIEADNNGDIEAVLSVYSDNATLMGSGQKPITGKVAIRQNYEEIFSNSKLNLTTLSTETLYGEGFAVNIGYTKGQVISKLDSSITTVDDKYIMILKKDPVGEWKIDRLIWNKNL